MNNLIFVFIEHFCFHYYQRISINGEESTPTTGRHLPHSFIHPEKKEGGLKILGHVI